MLKGLRLREFHKYYLQFLGAEDHLLDTGQRVFTSLLRSKPETESSYKVHDLLVSVYQDRIIHSVNPALAEKYRSVAPPNSSADLHRQVDDAFFRISPYKSYWISEWYRYSINNGFREDTDVVQLDHSHRDLIEEPRKAFRGKLFLERNWERVYSPALSDGRFFGVVKDGKLVSRSLVSELSPKAMNIEVSTRDEYKRQGYASKCVRQAVNWCLSNNRVPVYLVSASNSPSFRLAEGLGLKRQAREIRTSATITCLKDKSDTPKQ